MARNEAKPWIFGKESIQNSPSKQDGWELEQERATRKSVCKLIAEIGQTMHPRATIAAINSAKVFFHRVFMVQSMEKQNPKLVGVTCLFLACKSEECLRPLKQFIWTLNKLDRNQDGQKAYPFGKRTEECSRPWEIKEESEGFQEMKEKILACERVCLHVLGFELNVENPFIHMDRLLGFFDKFRKDDKEKRRLIETDDVGVTSEDYLGRQIIEMAAAMANDSSTTTLVLQYEAGVLAAGIINLALRIRKYSLIKLSKWCEKLTLELKDDSDQRLCGLEVTKEAIEDICNQLLDLYDESTAKQQDGSEKAAGAGQNGHAAQKGTNDSAAPSKPPQENASQQSNNAGNETLQKLEAGEVIQIPGSRHPYKVQKTSNGYKCSCIIWSSLQLVEGKRTCKHLQKLRGSRAELGRVGEDNVKKMEEKFDELQRQQPAARPIGSTSDHKRKAEGSAAGGDAKRPNNGH